MGWLLAQNVLMAAALAGVAAIMCRLRRVGPVARHALWLVVLVKLVTPPFLVVESPWSWPLPSWAPSPVAGQQASVDRPDGARMTFDIASARAPMSRMKESSAIASPYAARRQSAPADPAPAADQSALASGVGPRASGADGLSLVTWNRLSGWLVAVWIAGAIGLIGVQAVRVTRMARHVRRARLADSEVLAAVERVRGRLNLAPIAAAVVPDIVSPLIWSLHPRRPVLLWPERLPEGAPAGCVVGLITHELAHVKRRDHWVGWLELAAGAVWWWNPLFWFVRSRLRENAELACDAWVIDSEPQGRRAYAEALLAVCAVTSSRTAPMPAVGVGTGSRRFLERRLAMIMQERVPVRLSRLALVSLALTLAATLPVWAARMAQPGDGPQTASPKPAPVVQVTPVATAPVVSPEPVVAAPVQAIDVDRAILQAFDRHPELTQLLSPDRAHVEHLPEDAGKLLQRFADQQAEARREVEAKLAQQREALVKQLKAMQDTYTKAGSLDEAVAIRDEIRLLTASAERGMGHSSAIGYAFAPSGNNEVHVEGALELAPDRFYVTPFEHIRGTVRDPLLSALQALRGQSGASLVVELVGAEAESGRVWGTDVYTDDSSIAVAAVHAGLLKPGERGTVRVLVLPGQDSYGGTERHGVKSESFGKWQGSFRLEKADRR